MKITLDLSADQLDVLASAVADSITDHERQANRNGASSLARRGHLSMRDDLRVVSDTITLAVTASVEESLDAETVSA